MYGIKLYRVWRFVNPTVCDEDGGEVKTIVKFVRRNWWMASNVKLQHDIIYKFRYNFSDRIKNGHRYDTVPLCTSIIYK